MKISNPGFQPVTLLVSTLLFLFAGNTTASPLHGSVGYNNPVPSPVVMKSWIYSIAVQLSKLVGETQVDFAQIRLGDRDYDNYVHRIQGLPRPIWQQDKLQEQTLLEMEVKDLYIFQEFISEIKSHEKKDSLFVGSFKQIVNEINILISYIQQMEIYQGYPITHQGASVQPTRKPGATQKEQDEWDLGVLKELLYWLIPVQGELHRQLKDAE